MRHSSPAPLPIVGRHKCPSLLQFSLSGEFVHHAEVMREYQSRVIRQGGKDDFSLGLVVFG
jgi:hypothetical protein